jgi:hypothetical protein
MATIIVPNPPTPPVTSAMRFCEIIEICKNALYGYVQHPLEDLELTIAIGAIEVQLGEIKKDPIL